MKEFVKGYKAYWAYVKKIYICITVYIYNPYKRPFRENNYSVNSNISE